MNKMNEWIDIIKGSGVLYTRQPAWGMTNAQKEKNVVKLFTSLLGGGFLVIAFIYGICDGLFSAKNKRMEGLLPGAALLNDEK